MRSHENVLTGLWLCPVLPPPLSRNSLWPERKIGFSCDVAASLSHLMHSAAGLPVNLLPKSGSVDKPGRNFSNTAPVSASGQNVSFTGQQKGGMRKPKDVRHGTEL